MAISEGGGRNRTVVRPMMPAAAPRTNFSASTKQFNRPARMTPSPLRRKAAAPAKRKAPAPPKRAAAIARRGAKATAPLRPSRSGNFQASVPEAAAPPPAPGPIDEGQSIEQFLGGDETYQGQLAGFQKTLADFLADKTRRTGDIQRDYDTAKGLWSTNREKGKADVLNDYASRGLLRSGLYDTALTDFEKQMQDQLTALESNRTTGLAGLESEYTNLSREQELAQAQARQDALNRRAQMLAAGL